MSHCNINNLATIYELIEQNPGLLAADIIRRVPWNKYYVYCGALHRMEEQGFLLMQDGRRRLYVYGVRGIAKQVLKARLEGRLSSDAIYKVPTARVWQR